MKSIFSGKSSELLIDFTSNSLPRRRRGIKKNHNVNQKNHKFFMVFNAFLLLQRHEKEIIYSQELFTIY